MTENPIAMKIQLFANLVEEQQKARFQRDYPSLAEFSKNWKVKVTHCKKYSRVDVGQSGKYMVEIETGNIYGIKAYGVIHRGHQYGTLDTIGQYDWSDYVTRPAMNSCQSADTDQSRTKSRIT